MKIRIQNLRRQHAQEDLRTLAALRLRIPPDDISNVHVVKTSMDARHHHPVQVFVVDVQVREPEAVLQTLAGDSGIMPAPQAPGAEYSGPLAHPGAQPLVVGTGPAGLFITLGLLERGYRPIVIDRGRAVRPRWKDVNNYWNYGLLDPESNAVFGEGGAGTFSDGKLYTRRNDPRNPDILALLDELADAPDIRTAGKPHLGTNRLSRALLRLHGRLLEQGATLRFESRLEDLEITDGRITAAVVNGERVETDAVFLAAGHSARDVYRMLERRGVAMEARPFAVGARAEHPQALINRAQLGTEESVPEPADYMLTWNPEGGRSAYTFCMCPGGEVVAAGTEPDGLTVNGMSYSHRADRFGNAAVVVTVTPADYPGGGPLAGLEFQRRLERAAYEAGGGGHVAPAQRIRDFLGGRATRGEPETSYRRGVRGSDLTAILPEAVVAAMQSAIRRFGRLVAGYDGPHGVLIGVETRSSAPVRVLRDPVTYQSVNVAGLYPVGEGAGYAGGIMSSAADGLRAAERIAPRAGALIASRTGP